MEGGKVLLVVALLLATYFATGNILLVCLRHEHLQDVGFGEAQESVQIPQLIKTDVGRCKLRTVNRSKIKKGWDLCSSGEECLPAAETIEHHHLWGGEFREVGITRDCKCQTPASSCQRRAFRRTLFEGTKYLVSVDVWKCVGPCSLKNNMCIPIRNSTLLIDTPNGPSAIQGIAECGCAQPRCHRIPFFDEFKEEYDGKSTRVKRVDVGKCVGDGSCNGKGTPFCLKWDLATGNCSFFGETIRKCRPVRSAVKTFRATGGHQRNFAVITECQCE